jgi:hypothetical protein
LISLEENPNDPDLQAMVSAELKKLLAQDESVVIPIQELQEEIKGTKAGKTIIEQVAGNNSKQIGQVFGDVKL